MEYNIHQELLTEGNYSKTIYQTLVEVVYRFKPFNVLKENGLPVISHVTIKTTDYVTGKKAGKSHFFQPETLADYSSFNEFAEDAIAVFLKNGFIEVEERTQYTLF